MTTNNMSVHLILVLRCRNLNPFSEHKNANTNGGITNMATDAISCDNFIMSGLTDPEMPIKPTIGVTSNIKNRTIASNKKSLVKTPLFLK